ncbi:MAG: FAD-dependent oxidoreductase, partial [Burkholderiales bacterium]
MPDTFDLIVLGGGPAGASAAAGAGFLGKRAALVEKATNLGGPASTPARCRARR